MSLRISQKDLDTFLKFLDKPRTLNEMQGHFKKSRAAVYYWLRMVEDRVQRVGMERPTKYERKV